MIDRLAIALLLAGCAVFATIFFAQIGSGEHQESTATQVLALPSDGAAIHQQQAPQLEELVAAALTRPLFERPQEPAESNSAIRAGLVDTRLTGILTTPDQRVAIFAVTGASPLVLTEGETLGGWRLDSITPLQVSLSSLGDTKILQPEVDSALVSPEPSADGAPQLTFHRVLPDQQTRDKE